MKIVVDGTQLTVSQTRGVVHISRVVGRDRKRKVDITSYAELTPEASEALVLLRELKRVAALPDFRCTCDYRYGYSDHAEHCQSTRVAKYDGGCIDDD